MKDGPFEAEVTKYGFIWGPVSVERISDIGSGVVIGIYGCPPSSKTASIEVYVSKKGRKIRVRDKRGEWNPGAAAKSQPLRRE